MTDDDPVDHVDNPASPEPDRSNGQEADEAADAGEVSQEEAAWWWAQLPDFVRADYPFDLPPNRLPFARGLFDAIGAWRFCPEAFCRRRRTCRGGDGPPCFRADREVLGKVMLITWFRIFHDMPEEEWRQAFESLAPRYAADAGAEPSERPAASKPHGGGAGKRGPRRQPAARTGP